MVQMSMSGHFSNLYIYDLPKSLVESLVPFGSAAKNDNLMIEDEVSESDASEEDSNEDAAVENARRALNNASVVPSSGSPVTWFKSSLHPPPTKLGIFSAMFPPGSDVSNLQTRDAGSSEQISDQKERTLAMFMVRLILLPSCIDLTK